MFVQKKQYFVNISEKQQQKLIQQFNESGEYNNSLSSFAGLSSFFQSRVHLSEDKSPNIDCLDHRSVSK